MRGRLEGDYWGVVLDAPDARELARFYARLLGWKIEKEEPDWATLAPPSGVAYLGFQTSPEYVRPVWPPVEGRQQMMIHLDVEVRDLDAAVTDAVEMGATVAEFQPQVHVRVLLDPAGHPFCLYVDAGDEADGEEETRRRNSVSGRSSGCAIAMANCAATAVGGAALALEVKPRVAAALLTASLVPTTIAGHRFWEQEDAHAPNQQRIHFLKNVSMLGGLLLIAAEGER